MKTFLPLIFSLPALIFSGCGTTNTKSDLDLSHTGAYSSEEYIQDVDIKVVSQSAVQFGVIALHQGDTESATKLRDDLDAILADFPSGPEYSPDQLLTKLREDLSAGQRQRLAAEFASMDKHLSGKLANGSLVDTAQSYTTLECLTWMREAADFAARGFNTNVVRTHGVVLDETKFNPRPKGIVVGLDFLGRDENSDDGRRERP